MTWYDYEKSIENSKSCARHINLVPRPTARYHQLNGKIPKSLPVYYERFIRITLTVFL